MAIFNFQLGQFYVVVKQRRQNLAISVKDAQPAWGAREFIEVQNPVTPLLLMTTDRENAYWRG